MYMSIVIMPVNIAILDKFIVMFSVEILLEILKIALLDQFISIDAFTFVHPQSNKIDWLFATFAGCVQHSC